MDKKTDGSDRFVDQSHRSDHFSDQQKNKKQKKKRLDKCRSDKRLLSSLRSHSCQ